MGFATISTMVAQVIPADNYDAEIVSVTEVQSTMYEMKPQYAVKFRIIDPDEPLDGVTITKWVNRQLVPSDDDPNELVEKISPQSKLYEVITATDPNGEYPVGTGIDVVDFLKGKRVRINVTNEKKPTGETKSKITTILPYKRRKVTA